jgi:hypothetical protein
MSIIAPESVTKLTRIIPRADGSEVRITVDSCKSPNLDLHSFSYVHKRQSPEHDWALCSDTPHPDWRTMSVADYNEFGRCEKFQAVSHGEILSLSQWIGKPMSEFQKAHA